MNHPRIVFAMDNRDVAAVADLLEGKGAAVARVLSGRSRPRMVEAVLHHLENGETVVGPLEPLATGWQAPEGTEIVFSERVMLAHASDSDLVEQARMRSPEWSMSMGADVLEEGLDIALAGVDDAPLRELEDSPEGMFHEPGESFGPS